MKNKNSNIIRPQSKQPLPPSAQKVHAGIIFDVWQWKQELSDGSTTTFEKISRRDSVATFPILDDGRIVLTKQKQPGKKSFIAAPGGRINPGESAIDAAKRELLEETSLEAKSFALWKSAQPMDEIDWASYIFLAKRLRKVNCFAFDAGEKIELMYVSFDEFLGIAIQNNFYDKEIQVSVFKALLDPARMAELRVLFDPNN